MGFGPLEMARRRTRRRPELAGPASVAPVTTERSRLALLHRWRFFLAELVIVFLGVFGAALADDWRQRREEREQTRLLVANVVRTLDGLIRHDRRVRIDFQRRLEAFDTALKRGERPPFVYMFRRGARGVPTVGWDMLVGAGAANRLPPDRMYELGMYFATLESMSRQYSAYAEFLEAEVLPHKDDPGHFYIAGTNRLKPRYAENLERLRDVLGLEATLARRAMRLRRQLVAISGAGALASKQAPA